MSCSFAIVMVVDSVGLSIRFSVAHDYTLQFKSSRSSRLNVSHIYLLSDEVTVDNYGLLYDY